MVLEHLVSVQTLQKHFRYSVGLGMLYAVVGMFIAGIIFPQNAGIVSIFFASLLLTPSLQSLIYSEEQQEEREKHFSIKRLFIDNKQSIQAYTGVFIGVFTAYFLAAIVFPYFGVNVVSLLREQLFLDPAVAGRATYQTGLFVSILANNWLVILVTFFLALIIGSGAVFFVAWNASAWGAIFGFRVLAASQVAEVSVLYYAAILLSIVVWHVILEGGAYILAVISGSVISNDVISESKYTPTFILYTTIAIFGYILLWQILKGLPQMPAILLFMAILLSSLWFARHVFDTKHKEVFTYNYWLFVCAILMFILGVAVETYVLSNSQTLQVIYAQASMMMQ